MCISVYVDAYNYCDMTHTYLLLICTVSTHAVYSFLTLSTLYLHTICTLYTVCTVYSVHCIYTLYMYTVICTLLYSHDIQCTQYTYSVHCICILYLYTVYVHCIFYTPYYMYTVICTLYMYTV